MNEVKIRRFAEKDLNLLKETLNDRDITKYFRFFGHVFTEKEVIDFINNSFLKNTKHFAIVDEKDDYIGTISLKNIDYISKNAEYAIVLGNQGIGKGYARQSTDLVLFYAFNILKLNKIYFNVVSENQRAIKFYENYGFTFEGRFSNHLTIGKSTYDLLWYSIFKEKYSLITRENESKIQQNIIL